MTAKGFGRGNYILIFNEHPTHQFFLILSFYQVREESLVLHIISRDLYDLFNEIDNAIIDALNCR